MYPDFLSTTGAVALIFIVVKATLSFWNNFKALILSRLLGLELDFMALGTWAVVTGSTDGIGKGYALELAKRGLNIVLVSRSADKLKRVAEEIETTYAVKTKTIQFDFTRDPETYDKLEVDLADLEIGVLVNNVGLGRPAPSTFLEIPETEVLKSIITVNCNAITYMTRIVLPKMLERRMGVIINISSLFGSLPTPMSNVYSATKAYVDFFSRSVAAEYKSQGVIIQCVLPGVVATNMAAPIDVSLFVPDPRTYAASALSTVGHQSRTYGYWPHALMGGFLTCLPDAVYHRLATRMLMSVPKRLIWLQQRKKEK